MKVTLLMIKISCTGTNTYHDLSLSSVQFLLPLFQCLMFVPVLVTIVTC